MPMLAAVISFLRRHSRYAAGLNPRDFAYRCVEYLQLWSPEGGKVKFWVPGSAPTQV